MTLSARCELIAELATNHGGDLALAEEMIRAAADSGADWVKTQGYQIRHLPSSDPQYEWLKQCELSERAHERLMTQAQQCGVRYLSTAYTSADLERFSRLGLRSVKIGSGESANPSLCRHATLFDTVIASVAWGEVPATLYSVALKPTWRVMTTVPLYPMPPECFDLAGRTVGPMTGWSDHADGIAVAQIAMARGAPLVEKHFSLPGRGRNEAWDMWPDDLRRLRAWAETCAIALGGTRYHGRWSEQIPWRM